MGDEGKRARGQEGKRARARGLPYELLPPISTELDFEQSVTLNRVFLLTECFFKHLFTAILTLNRVKF